MKARIGAVLAVTVTMLGLMAVPAHAYGVEITRVCDGKKTTYMAYTANNGDYAYTRKSGSSCAGHAWLRVKSGGKWGSWQHDPSKITIDPAKGIEVAHHKGCADCTVWITSP
ncbi:hypothetical protein [Actinophytocola gossypii]|uniref:DUF2690 domain-containing protein n=1 Tax=Actinophytocola gossypii TaxID=2812003 RepID=A0ABT2JH40_9PSEU|nr:hypothetical protein [Actinophytocola gossypii]MCT2587189.1 hypothetical protein [Actinophytocola gossypii]